MDRRAIEPLSTKTTLLALVACVIWGGNLVALKFALLAFEPLWAAWWRMVFGLLVVWLWARYQRIDVAPEPGEIRPLAIQGTLFAGQIALLNFGTDLTSPAYALILISTHPIFSNVIGHFAKTEHRLTPLRFAGLLIAFGGTAYLAAGRPIETLAPKPLVGNLLMVCSALLLGIRNVYTRKMVQTIPPIRAVVWQVIVALPLFLVLAVLFERPMAGELTLAPILGLAYQSVIVAGFCFITWTILLQRHAAGTLAVLTFSVPFFGVLLSALFFSEPVTGRILLAAALLTVGMLLVGRK